jgi:hypothetical protein
MLLNSLQKNHIFLCDMTVYLMNHDPDFIKDVISKYTKQKKTNPMLLKKVVNNEFDQIFENLTNESILYFKDFNLWSDNNY